LDIDRERRRDITRASAGLNTAEKQPCRSTRSALMIMNKGKKILVVDDNEVILKTLSLKLTSSGYTVITAIDGSSAVSAARKDKPDLILLDISFPPDVAHGGGVPWDGFLIINWLRRIDDASTIPVIVITGGDAAKYKDRALAAGAVAFFQKPIDNNQLLETIGKILGDTPGAKPAS
jgi:CheY-like chemotaxis protein